MFTDLSLDLIAFREENDSGTGISCYRSRHCKGYFSASEGALSASTASVPRAHWEER